MCRHGISGFIVYFTSSINERENNLFFCPLFYNLKVGRVSESRDKMTENNSPERKKEKKAQKKTRPLVHSEIGENETIACSMIDDCTLSLTLVDCVTRAIRHRLLWGRGLKNRAFPFFPCYSGFNFIVT